MPGLPLGFCVIGVARVVCAPDRPNNHLDGIAGVRGIGLEGVPMSLYHMISTRCSRGRVGRSGACIPLAGAGLSASVLSMATKGPRNFMRS